MADDLERRRFLRGAALAGAAGLVAGTARSEAVRASGGVVVDVPLDEAASGAANRDTLAALAAGAAPGTTLVLPAGRFPFADFDVPQDSLVFEGAGRPSFAAGDTTLVGGTQLVGGTFGLNDTFGTVVRHLGIDISGVARNAISSGGQGNTERRCRLEHVAALGSGSKHGAVFTSGGGNTVVDFEAVDFDHGLVFRCSDSSASSVAARSCGLSGITIKSHPNFGDALRNTVTGFRLADARLVVTAHGATAAVANVVGDGQVRGGPYGVSIKAVDVGGAVGHVGGNTLSAVHVSDVARSSFAVQGARSGTIVGCSSYGAGTNGFWTNAPTEVDLIACTSNGDGNPVSGDFRTVDVAVNSQP